MGFVIRFSIRKLLEIACCIFQNYCAVTIVIYSNCEGKRKNAKEKLRLKTHAFYQKTVTYIVVNYSLQLPLIVTLGTNLAAI